MIPRRPLERAGADWLQDLDGRADLFYNAGKRLFGWQEAPASQLCGAGVFSLRFGGRAGRFLSDGIPVMGIFV